MVVSLKVCIDESGDPRRNDFFTVAGIVANATQWRAFYSKWRSVLRTKPTIRYFKMTEAHQRTGQFLGWKRRDISEKVRLLTSVLVENTTCTIISVVPQLQFRRIMLVSSLPDEYTDPYLLGFVRCLRLIAHKMDALPAGSRKPLIVCDHLSDRQKEARVVSIFDAIAAAEPGGNWYSIGRWLGDLEFRHDDSEEIALQAADLVAWHYRTVPWELHWRRRPMRLSFKRIGKLPVLGEALRPTDVVEWRFGLQAFLKASREAATLDRADVRDSDPRSRG
jgi:hypothetical protein